MLEFVVIVRLGRIGLAKWRLAKAREYSQRAVQSADRADAKEIAAWWRANAALREAEFGNASPARQNALAALALAPGRDVSSLVALALARAGDTAQAQKLAERLSKDLPQDTMVQGYWLPSIWAAIELNARDAAKAVEILQTAVPFKLGKGDPCAGRATTKGSGRKEANVLLIGCDYHPSVQQIAWLNTETGECGERRLAHCPEAEQFYRELKQTTPLCGVGRTVKGQDDVMRYQMYSASEEADDFMKSVIIAPVVLQ